jgi:hypothetical protein
MVRRVVPLLVLLGALSASAAPAQTASPTVARSEKVGGRTYTQWEAAFVRWRYSLPRRPESSDGVCAAAKQKGPVYFLHGNLVSDTPTLVRRCSVPAGRYVMLGVPNNGCTTVSEEPFFAETDRDLRACAHKVWKAYGSIAPPVVTLDGVKLRSGYLVTTPAFSFKEPKSDNVLQAPGATRGRTAQRAYALILRPLSPGLHVLVQTLRYKRDVQRTVSYQITAG